MISKETDMPGKSDLPGDLHIIIPEFTGQACITLVILTECRGRGDGMGCLCSLPMHTFHTDAGCSPCAAGVPGILQKCMGKADLDMGVSKNRK